MRNNNNAGMNKTKILIVDESPEHSISLGVSLGSKYDFVVARTLEEAKSRVDDTVELAIVDGILNREDEVDEGSIYFLTWIKENFPQIPFILTSAFGRKKIAAKVEELGAFGFFQKPLNLPVFKKSIQRISPTLN